MSADFVGDPGPVASGRVRIVEFCDKLTRVSSSCRVVSKVTLDTAQGASGSIADNAHLSTYELVYAASLVAVLLFFSVRSVVLVKVDTTPNPNRHFRDSVNQSINQSISQSIYRDNTSRDNYTQLYFTTKW